MLEDSCWRVGMRSATVVWATRIVESQVAWGTRIVEPQVAWATQIPETAAALAKPQKVLVQAELSVALRSRDEPLQLPRRCWRKWAPTSVELALGEGQIGPWEHWI